MRAGVETEAFVVVTPNQPIGARRLAVAPTNRQILKCRYVIVHNRPVPNDRPHDSETIIRQKRKQTGQMLAF
jgi:hypothetical protein